jgi:predicted acetyltransferase
VRPPYAPSVPELVEPTVALREAWLAAHAEWGPGLHEDGFGITAADDVASEAGFAAWVAGLGGRPDATLRWIVEDGRVQGGIALRHRGDERSGHVGYGVRPSARGRGLATWALGAMLGLARGAGLPSVVVVCEDGNAASARVIERNGGRLVEVRRSGRVPVRVYRIGLTTPA